MPCTCDGYGESDKTWESRLDELAELLCACCKAMDAKKPMPASVMKWWHKHQEADRAHAEKSALLKAVVDKRKKALAKLTGEERKLLGL